MNRKLTILAITLAASITLAQSPSPTPKTDSFEVATIKPVESDAKTGRYIKMQDAHRFLAKDYTLKLLIAAAFELSPKAVLGGPLWSTEDHFDIQAVTPGYTRPTRDQQMAMLRTLLTDRFQLTFHRESKDFSIYTLAVVKTGPKLKPSTAPRDDPAALITTVYPQRLVLPARNATMAEFASLLQRALLDRPVVDKTSLTGKFDFDLEWAPDETQFGGEIPAASADANSPPFFTAIQQQLGLKLEATRGPVNAFVIDKAEHPTAN